MRWLCADITLGATLKNLEVKFDLIQVDDRTEEVMVHALASRDAS